MNQKGFINIFVIISVVLAAIAGGYFVLHQRIFLPASFPKLNSELTPPESDQINSISNNSTANPPKIVSSQEGINPPALYIATVGVLYSAKLYVIGFSNDKPLNWSITSGSLPPGLAIELSGKCGIYGPGLGGGTLTNVDTLICGTPTKAGTYSFTIQASVPERALSTSRVYNLVVNYAPTPSLNQTSPSARLANISPASGTYGVQATITGTGFTKIGNTINFRTRTPGAVVNKIMNPEVSSTDGTHLVFTLQKTVHLSAPGYNYDETFDPGEYDVIVTNPNGHSNSIIFTITNIQATNSPPPINSYCGKPTCQ